MYGPGAWSLGHDFVVGLWLCACGLDFMLTLGLGAWSLGRWLGLGFCILACVWACGFGCIGPWALDLGPWTLGFAEMLIFHGFEKLFEACINYGFGVVGRHILEIV